MVDITVPISGNPTLVTAQLNTQSISLIQSQTAGEFLGTFTFNQSEDLTQSKLSIEARDSSGIKTNQEFPVNIESHVTGSAQSETVPVSNEAGVIKILRIIFGIFAVIYLGFLILDAVILHRDKIKRDGIRPNAHLLIFVILVGVTLFTL